MAHFRKVTRKKGAEVYAVMFKRPSPSGKRKFDTFYLTFATEEESREFAKKWEAIFMLKGPGAIEVDRTKERLKRRFPEHFEEKA